MMFIYVTVHVLEHRCAFSEAIMMPPWPGWMYTTERGGSKRFRRGAIETHGWSLEGRLHAYTATQVKTLCYRGGIEPLIDKHRSDGNEVPSVQHHAPF